MSDEIIKILDDLGQRFGIAIDWSSQNVMPYLKDLMSRFASYEVITSIIWIVIALVGIIGCLVGILVVNKHANKVLEEDPYSDWNSGRGVLIVIGIIAIGCFVICIIFQSLDIVTCYTIPEKMILEYLKDLSFNG